MIHYLHPIHSYHEITDRFNESKIITKKYQILVRKSDLINKVIATAIGISTIAYSQVAYAQELKNTSFLEIALFSLGCIATITYTKLTSKQNQKTLKQMQEKQKQLLNYLLDLSFEKPAYEQWKHTYQRPITEVMN